jgi:thiol-disulfide isomerase/thioredoxin
MPFWAALWHFYYQDWCCDADGGSISPPREIRHAMKHTGPRALTAALLVLLGIWAGARVYSTKHAQIPRSIATPAGVASAPNPSDPADADPALAKSSIPERLPQFSLNDLQGKLKSPAAWPGQSLVLNFWATWCAPCRREIPLLQNLSADWAGRGVTIVGVAVDYRDKVQEFATQFKIRYPLLVGEQDALDLAAQLGMASPAFPFTVFTDKRGEVLALFVGELHRPQADLILSVLQNLNQDQVQLPEARRMIADGLEKLADNRSG